MSFEQVCAAYGARADDYIEAVGRIDHVATADLTAVTSWARSIDGLILDVGCGPGQWTAHLAGLGLDVAGLDPTPQFVDRARAAHPGLTFWVGRAEQLGVVDSSVGGILAWYSLIHLQPELIGQALTECARVLRPGGGLALGFFTGADLAPFDHAVTTAHFWPVDLLCAEVTAAGFVVTHTESRTDRPGRTHALILALRTDDPH